MAPVVRPENTIFGWFDPRTTDVLSLFQRALGPTAPAASNPGGQVVGQGDSLNAPNPGANFSAFPGLAPLLANPRAAARAADPTTVNNPLITQPLTFATPAELRRAKKALETLGYQPGRMDTPKARAEIAAFQQAMGLTTQLPGEVTDRTLKKLEQTAKRVKSHKKKPYYTQGMRSGGVKKLQQRLQRLGDFHGTANGVFGEDTARAVLTFRKRHPEVPQDIRSWGQAAQRGLKTELENMAHDPFRSRAKPSAERRRRDAAASEEARTDGIGPGSPKHVIKHFQRELLRAGYNTNRFDGVWTAHTAAMAEQFERRAGITHQGDADRFGSQTWNALKKLSLETNEPFSPVQNIGERSAAVLRTERRLKKAGYNPGKVDGVYSTATEAAADRLRRHFGIRRDRDGVGGTTDKLIDRRIKERSNQIHRPIAAPLTSNSEFLFPDAEGAPSASGRRYHAGKDWFAPGGSRVSSPISGRVVDVQPSSGNSGQVFGGVVRVQGKDGKTWVFRHVDPSVREGQTITAGQKIATVTPWTGGSSHAHIELWKSFNPNNINGGYRIENMIDPMKYLKRFL